jgi:hypothetical protein
MQLLEFFIWRNIHNKEYNRFFSLGAFGLLSSQPIFSVMQINNSLIRNGLLAIYIFLVIPYFIIQLPPTHKLHFSVSKTGHLQWGFANMNLSNWILWLFFFLFQFFYNQKVIGYIFILITLGISVYNYSQDNSIGSMWCWLVNSAFIYYAFLILIYLPFCENRNIC